MCQCLHSGGISRNSWAATEGPQLSPKPSLPQSTGPRSRRPHHPRAARAANNSCAKLPPAEADAQTRHPGGGERCVTDGGHALRTVLVSGENPRRRCGCVLRSALQNSLCTVRTFPRSETGRSAPLGTGGNRTRVNTSVPPGQLRHGQRADFLWLSTRDHASEGPRGRGRERGVSLTQVP